MRYGYLKGREVIETNDVNLFAEKNGDLKNRTIGNDEVIKGGDVAQISTVFLGINHSFGGPAQWFETMVFCKNIPFINTSCRYATHQEAEAGHKKILAEVKQKMGVK